MKREPWSFVFRNIKTWKTREKVHKSEVKYRSNQFSRSHYARERERENVGKGREKETEEGRTSKERESSDGEEER